MRKISRLGLLLTAAVSAVWIMTSADTVIAAEETTIEEGIYFGNVDVGGMTEEQARSAVEEYVAGLMGTTFSLQGETGSIQMTAEDMGVAADADVAVEEALAVGHAGSLINRYKTIEDLKTQKLPRDSMRVQMSLLWEPLITDLPVRMGLFSSFQARKALKLIL